MTAGDTIGTRRRTSSVLVVDDEPTIRNILTQNLELRGFPCRTAEDVASALEAVAEEEPEVVISDIRMPGADGTELLAELGRSYPDIAVIMLTAFAEVDLAVQCLRDGASDFLTKPVRAAHLVTAVERALERRRLILENRSYQVNLEQRIKVATQGLTQTLHDLDLAYDMTLAALSSAVDAREVSTGDHSRRVTRMSNALAEELGLDRVERKHLSRGALLHDIGKIGISDAVLLKTGKLTADEMAIMQQHPEIGYRILEPIRFLARAMLIVRYHHENFDGSGYPYGLSGDAIPRGARIFSVVDALDAMTSTRTYRKAMDLDAAIGELDRCSGSQFDPEVVDALHAVGRERIETMISPMEEV
ncbi:MAG: response regulator [Thermoanaerobaculales bacterium]|nr:response regulator [Thermoanaerobaculales bacterium]